MLNTSTIFAPIAAGILANGFNLLRYRAALLRYRADRAAGRPTVHTGERATWDHYVDRRTTQIVTATMCAGAVAVSPVIEWF
ncbi:hypothetical protein [Rhodococcus qingshengii]|uniref:hypothetical protein n=1 Tax=Rhodococcus qingshengii TaxID=334542 RepID=UPI001C8C2CBD|nr:hypothetical protein [Rhodococcus qingshengii]MBX9152249.1 hypothetical protein [Rhodococcus qingshengii]